MLTVFFPLFLTRLERRAQATLTPVYEKRREVLKTIPHFWAVALMNHTLIAMHAQHHTDKLALSYLEDLWIVRDKDEPKVFTIEFVRVLFFYEM